MLFPEGVSSVEDAPDDLCAAIAHAQKILNWYKNLREYEVPPAYLWPFDELLVPWFKRVKDDRENNRTPDKNADRGGEDGWVENDFAKDLRG